MKHKQSLGWNEERRAGPKASSLWRRFGRSRVPVCVAMTLLATATGWANGGPFVIKYPGGDPAAKGVLARLDPDLKPARESRLQVVNEDLAIGFGQGHPGFHAVKADAETPPLVSVTASYLITNPTPEAVEVDFGFPILRGIYVSPFSMMPMPDAQVRVDGTYSRPVLISNSAIYGILRRKAVAAIERALQADSELRQRFDAVRSAKPEAREASRQGLADYLTSRKGWTPGEAALLVELAALQPVTSPALMTNASARQQNLRPGFFWDGGDASVQAAKTEASWATTAIGEQKATQWLNLLAGRLDPTMANSYEAIFQAWGGDVRERSVDLETGRIRARELSRERAAKGSVAPFTVVGEVDPTVYARVDYLDANKSLTGEQKASWKAVLKHLPVVFTFAPMNLLHYHVSFPANSQRTVTVSYRQYAYLDTALPESYQVAYVVHPASQWDSFGPIHLAVTTPEGVTPVTTRPLHWLANAAQPMSPEGPPAAKLAFKTYSTLLTEKTGELFVGINAEDWRKAAAPKEVSAVVVPGKTVSR